MSESEEIQEMWQKYLKHALPPSDQTVPPLLQMRIHSHKNSEKYYASCERGRLDLNAGSQLAARYGCFQLKMGVASGHLPELLGENAPKYPLRPLWLTGESFVQTAEGVRLALPEFVTAELLADSRTLEQHPLVKQFCWRLLQLGYNAVVLGSGFAFSDKPLPEIKGEVALLCKAIQSFGLKVILEPGFTLNLDLGSNKNCSPLDQAVCSRVQKLIGDLLERVPGFDYLLWQGGLYREGFAHHRSAGDHTRYELVLAEVKMVEKALSKKSGLIYYTPAPNLKACEEQASWLPTLCDDVGDRTVIAFSALAGEPWQDHLELHPLWQALRSIPDASSTLLLPVLNGGSIQQGGGLWPTLPLDLLESCFMRMYRHRFAGALVLSQTLPAEGGWLDCQLWVAGQAMWRDTTPTLLAHTWLLAYYPELADLATLSLMRQGREIVKQLSLLRYGMGLSVEAQKSLAESVLSQLECLAQFSSEEQQAQLRYFMRDGKRLIFHVFQELNLQAAKILSADDAKESFWVEGAGSAKMSGFKLQFRTKPFEGKSDPLMTRLYNQHRFELPTEVTT